MHGFYLGIRESDTQNVTVCYVLTSFFCLLFYRPIEEQKDYIQTTDVYKVLKKLPKGGNMHTHESKVLADHV